VPADARLRVRLLQTDPRLGDVAGNLDRLHRLIASGPDADLVVAPELATHGYHLGALDDLHPLSAEDSRITALGRHGPTVVAGFVEQSGHLVYNSAVIASPTGAAVQRKMYLPTYGQWEERKHFHPGPGIETYDAPGTRIAVLVCADMWQPAIPWLAAQAGAEVLVVPANSAASVVGPETRRAWEAILLHAALTLQVYVVFVNRTGVESGTTFWGGSLVVSPRGEVRAQLGDEPGETSAELDLADLRALRREWPLLQDPRFDLVASEALRIERSQP
jgi:predicted amidohydrolase